MDYVVVFEVSASNPENIWFPAIGLVFVAIGVGLVVYRERFREGAARILPFAFLGFALLWTTVATVAMLSASLGLASALRQGRCNVVEGLVTQFDPMPYQGHKLESFVVAGQRFEYSDYVLSSGFHQTASHGGPIRSGLRVRIHHVGNDIARLEIAR
jgi:hypothetical protein